MIKRKIIFLILLLNGLLNFNAKASHFMGGNLYYQYLGMNSSGNFQYLVTLKVYRDDSGIPLGSTQDLSVYQEGSSSTKTFYNSYTLSQVSTGIIPIPGQSAGCSFTAPVVIEQRIYTVTIALPFSATGYHLMAENCCRNLSITNLTNTGIDYYAFIPPTYINNSSPVFTDPPVPYICVNDTTSLVNSVVDPNGDVLVYSFVKPYSDGFTGTFPIPTVTYINSDYNVANPFGLGSYAYINAATGLTKYKSPSSGQYVVAVEIKEYRNNTLIGITRRDIQISAVPCPPNPGPNLGANVDSGFVVTDYTIKAGDSICFTPSYTDPGGDSLYLVRSGNIFNSTITNPPATMSNVAGLGSVSSQFCWNTSCTQKGFYTFVLKVTDNGCPKKTNNQVFSINVLPVPPLNIIGAANVCYNQSLVPYSVTAVTGSTYHWFITGGTQATGTNTNSIKVNWGSSSIGIVKVVETNSNGCKSDTAELVINMNSPPVSNAGSDVTTCSGTAIGIGSAPVSLRTYLWTPSTGLSSATSSNPTITLTNTASSNVPNNYIVATTLNGCKSYDTIVVTIKPQPVTNAGPDTSTCTGVPISIGSATIVGQTYSWSPSTGLSSSTVSNPVVTLTNSTSSPVSYTYTVTAIKNLCTHTDQVTVTVSPPIATPNAGSDITLCHGVGGSIGVAAVAGYTYSWSPTAGLSNSLIANPTVTRTNTTSGNVVYTYTLTASKNGCSSTDQVSVTIKPRPVANAGVDTSICPNVAGGIGVSPLPGYSYSWSPVTGLSNSSISNPTITLPNSTSSAIISTYTLTATNNGCNNTDQVVVTVKPLPVSNAGADDTICSGGSTVIGTSTTSGNTYSWTPSTGLSSSTVPNPTVTLSNSTSVMASYTYTVTTGLNGCSSSDQVVIKVKPVPPLNAGADVPLCSGSTINIGSAPLLGYTYSWSPPTGLSDPAIANPTLTLTNTTSAPVIHTYILTATYDGCTTRDTLNVNVKNLPVSEAGNAVSFCSGSSATIGTPSTIGYTYLWSPTTGLNNALISNPSVTLTNITTANVTSVYIVTTTLDNCSTTDAVNVTVKPFPIPEAGNAIAFCSGDKDSIGNTVTPGYAYLWSPATGLSSTTIPNPNVTLINLSSVAETHKYFVNTTRQGCSKSDSVVVTVNPLPLANAGLDVFVCPGSNSPMNATGGLNYSWTPATWLDNPSIANPTTTPAGTLDYVVLVADINNCKKRDTVKVEVGVNVPTHAGADKSICFGDSVTLGGSPTSPLGVTFSWTPALAVDDATLANPVSFPTLTTLYIVNTSNDTCTGVDTILITVNPLPLVDAGIDTAICTLDSVTIGTPGIHSYNWSPLLGLANGFSPVTNTSPDSTTMYVLTATDINNCKNRDSVQVVVNMLPPAHVGVDSNICLGENIVIGDAPIIGNTYSWSSVPPGFNSSQANPLVTPTITSNYLLTETINATGCFKKDSTVISVNPLPGAITGNDTAICLHESTIIGSNLVVGHTYSWSSNPVGFTSLLANPTVTPNESTRFILNEKITATGCHKIDSMQITINPLPNANTGADSPICFGQNIGIGATAVVGNTYSWVSSPIGFTSSIANPTVSPALTTKFILTEINTTTNCQEKDTATITVNPLPNALVGVDHAICLGQSTSIGSATSPVSNTYSWTSIPAGFTSGLPNPTVSPLVTTSYILIENMSITNCSKTDTVVITVNALPGANTGTATSICNGQSTTIGSAAIPGNTYSWSSVPAGFTSSQANPTVSPTVTTTYTLTETNSSTTCSKNNTVTVTVNLLPNSAAIADTTICDGSTLSIGAAPLVGNTYSWSSIPAGFSSSNSNPSVNPADTLKYVLTQTITATTCFKKDTVLVNVNPIPVAPAATSNSPVCEGDDINLFASSLGTIFSWSGPSFSSTTKNPVITSATTTNAGTYTVNVKINGCTSPNGSVVVSITLKPHAHAGNDTIVCVDSTDLQLNGSVVGGTTTGTWTTSGTGTFLPNANTLNAIYQISNADETAGGVNLFLTSTNNGDCLAAIDTLEVTITTIPVVNAGSDQTVCENDATVQLEGTISGGAGTGMWNSTGTGSFMPGNTDLNATYIPSTSDISSGGCTLNLVSTNACLEKNNAMEVSIIAAPMAEFATSKQHYNFQEEINFIDQSTDAQSWDWNFGDNTGTSNLQNPSYTYLQTGDYSVMLVVTNAGGCIDTAVYDLDILAVPAVAPSAFSPNGDNVNDIFLIKGGPFVEFTLKIYNQWGNQLFVSNNQADGWDGTKDGKEQSTGAYLYVFSGKLVDGKSVKASGDITLVR